MQPSKKNTGGINDWNLQEKWLPVQVATIEESSKIISQMHSWRIATLTGSATGCGVCYLNGQSWLESQHMVLWRCDFVWAKTHQPDKFDFLSGTSISVSRPMLVLRDLWPRSKMTEYDAKILQLFWQAVSLDEQQLSWQQNSWRKPKHLNDQP